MLKRKEERLQELLIGYGSCLVAYSGGVDSAYLAKVAVEVLGRRALAVIADSPSLPRRELEEARRLADQHGIPLRVVRTREFSNASYLANPIDRCYFCKHALFEELAPIARAEGFAAILYGENASDVGDHRPGAVAAAEFAVRAPLKEAGLLKSEIRELSALRGLPTADKPEAACLSSRVMTGEPVTPAKLAMIEAAEDYLRLEGFRDLRVRHHELAPSAGAPPRHLARIELAVKELPLLFIDQRREHVLDALRAIGYAHVTFDLGGYRRGGGSFSPLPFHPAVAAATMPPASRGGTSQA